MKHSKSSLISLGALPACRASLGCFLLGGNINTCQAHSKGSHLAPCCLWEGTPTLWNWTRHHISLAKKMPCATDGHIIGRDMKQPEHCWEFCPVLGKQNSQSEPQAKNLYYLSRHKFDSGQRSSLGNSPRIFSSQSMLFSMWWTYWKRRKPPEEQRKLEVFC